MNESVINYIKEQSMSLKSIKESFDVLYNEAVLLENGRQVRLSDNFGNTFIINLESYIQNELMDYCNRHF